MGFRAHQLELRLGAISFAEAALATLLAVGPLTLVPGRKSEVANERHESVWQTASLAGGRGQIG